MIARPPALDALDELPGLLTLPPARVRLLSATARAHRETALARHGLRETPGAGLFLSTRSRPRVDEPAPAGVEAPVVEGDG